MTLEEPLGDSKITLVATRPSPLDQVVGDTALVVEQ